MRRLEKYHSPTKGTTKKIISILISIVVIIFIVIGINLGEKSSKSERDNFKPKIVDTATNKTIDVTIFVPKDNKLYEKKVRVIDNKLKVHNKLDILVKFLISENFLPKGCHLIGNINIENNVAYCNFSNELLDVSCSSNEEALLLDSIGKSLVSPEDNITAVQILVQGEKIETLGGHLDLSEPYVP